MPQITRDQVRVPADVMPESRDEYIENFMKATRGTGRLMLFACDQKIEHLNKDFYGEGIDIADAELWHYFPEMMRLSRSTSSRSAARACAACWPASAGSSRSTPPTIPRSTTS